jgi:hypothetical protein
VTDPASRSPSTGTDQSSEHGSNSSVKTRYYRTSIGSFDEGVPPVTNLEVPREPVPPSSPDSTLGSSGTSRPSPLVPVAPAATPPTEGDTEGRTASSLEKPKDPSSTVSPESSSTPTLEEVVANVKENLSVMLTHGVDWSKFVYSVFESESDSYPESTTTAPLWMYHQVNFMNPVRLEHSQFTAAEEEQLRSFERLTRHFALSAATTERHLFKYKKNK